ncbi:FecR domain-containing protein [Sphingomonas sp.]|uniref:FecR family protein n=1 Tax=Sphingomonas sp. TaxID=28214 RepID=UPI001B13FCAD|nr:FecR domain-containing protein [Sphingomonas sp.]MBO9713303.1 FecR domain-containing protein [Sphingomonas sp.]
MSRADTVEQAAAEWLGRREEAAWSATDEAAFGAWMEASLAHKAAYWRLEHGWRMADRIGALGPVEPVAAPPASRRPARIALAALAASLLVALVGSALWLMRPQTVPIARFHTPVGGHQLVALADGSRIELNTATEVRSAVGAARREVWLDRGEAYFEVALRRGEAFIVHAGSRTITALGTKFSVRCDGDTVSVSVLEGSVRIEDALRGGAAASATATKGDRVIIRGVSTLVAAQSVERVEDALAWRDGMLAFDQTPLSEAAAEFNRYNHRRLVIDDPAVASIRIGGAFQASNVDAFARLLKDAYGLRMTVRQDEIVISS